MEQKFYSLIEDQYQALNLLNLDNLPQHSWILFNQNPQKIKLNQLNLKDKFIWLIDKPHYPLLTAKELNDHPISWIAEVDFLKEKFNHKLELLFNPYQTLQALIKNKILIKTMMIDSNQSVLTNDNSFNLPKTILAIIPHLNCNQWLDYCLFSLVNQTHSLTNIVVVDDGSKEIPYQICCQYPQVTLLSTPQRVGPYQIIQSLMAQTNYDAYMFQDADDWSIPERLEIILNLMKETNADVVGTQEYRVDEINQTIMPVIYPLDVNLALKEKPGHGLLHPTSLIRRSAMIKLNGFANGLLFGGDTEFLLRGHFHLKICNTPDFCYFRRKRWDSLTTSTLTGLHSPARQELSQKIKQRAYVNYERIAQGKPPLITPISTQKIIKFNWLDGLQLEMI